MAGGIPPYVFAPYVSGSWYPNYCLALGTATPTTGKIYAYPILVTRLHTFTKLGNWVTAGGTSSVLRFGIYADNGSGAPGNLVLDAGTATAVTGAAAASGVFSQALSPGLYWLAIVVNSTSGAPTLTTDATTRASVVLGQTGVTAAQGQSQGYQTTGTSTTGPLPATFPASAVNVPGTNTIPLVLIQA